MEALAVRRGMNLAIEKNYQRVVLEMDSKVIHDEVVKDKVERNWKIWPIIRDIRRILNQIPEK